MKIEEWKFGHIRENNVVVSNEPIYSFPIFGSYFLKDVKIEINENGTLRITGTETIYNFYIHKTSENEWREEPEEEEIKVRKVGLWRKKKERYVEGWVKTKKRTPLDLGFNNWSLRRL